jgi:hypothetical protein
MSDRAAYAVLLVLGALCMITFLVVRVPRAQQDRVLTTDGVGYFSYLRSLLFDHDLDFHNEYESLYWNTEYTPGANDIPATGMAGNNYSIGPAVLWVPFYLVGHLLSLAARSADVLVDNQGYGLIYQSAVSLATIAYVTAGSMLTYRVCRRRFSSWASLLAVSGLWLASPLFHYTVGAPDMSHGVSFFAVALFLWVWHPPRSRTSREWVLLGLTAGLMTLVRWQNVLYLSMLAVEAFQATWSSGVASRGETLCAYAKGGVVVGLLAITVFIPQALAWNIIYGSPLTVPQGGSFFDWLHPNLLEYLFSTRHGLYAWTPIVLLATIGLVPLWRKEAKVATPLVVALLLQWYLNSATTDWWAHGSFGARRFVSATPLFALGLAALTERAATRFRYGHLILLGTVGCLVAWNFLFDLQYSWGFIPRDQALSLRQLTVGKLDMVLQLLRRAISLLPH